MFESLSEKLDNIFKKLKGRGVLNEENINASLKEIRMALLEADVNFKVAKDFIEDVRVKAVGREVLESITPASRSSRSFMTGWWNSWAAAAPQ